MRILQQEAKLDDLEQYGRRNSLRISGLEEDFEVEDLPARVKNVQIDRLHRVGPRPRRDTDRTQKHRSRLVLVKYANYTSRDAVIKTRSSLKEKLPGVFINEDPIQPKAKLLYQARKLKNIKQIIDCWTVDGRLVFKDCVRKMHTVVGITDLNRVASSDQYVLNIDLNGSSSNHSHYFHAHYFHVLCFN